MTLCGSVIRVRLTGLSSPYRGTSQPKARSIGHANPLICIQDLRGLEPLAAVGGCVAVGTGLGVCMAVWDDVSVSVGTGVGEDV